MSTVRASKRPATLQLQKFAADHRLKIKVMNGSRGVRYIPLSANVHISDIENHPEAIYEHRRLGPGALPQIVKQHEEQNLLIVGIHHELLEKFGFDEAEYRRHSDDENAAWLTPLHKVGMKMFYPFLNAPDFTFPAEREDALELIFSLAGRPSFLSLWSQFRPRQP